MRKNVCASRFPLNHNFLFSGVLAAVLSGFLIAWPWGQISCASTVLEIGCFHKQDFDGKVPAGWRLEPYKGKPVLAIEWAGGQYLLRMSASGDTAFGVKKDISVDVRRYPFLQWTWKARKLPVGGDVRRAALDDQALQLYVVFPAVGFPPLYKSPTIAYIWDNEAPRGLMVRSPQKMLGYVQYLVLRNKTDPLDTTLTETRNIHDDYRRLFAHINNGEPPGPARALLLFINTHHTRSTADGSIGAIIFHDSPPQGGQP